MLEPLLAVTRDLNTRFPDGNTLYQIVARLLEESGELAQQVAHFEGSGVKRAKYGEPNPQKMAKEVMDVIRVALQVALYYKIEAQVEALFDENLKRLMPNDQ